MSVLVICTDASRSRGVLTQCGWALDRGEQVTLLTAAADDWPADIDPRLRVVEVGRDDALLAWLIRLEGALLGSLPRFLFAVVRTVSGWVARAGLGSVAAKATRGLERARRAQGRAASAVHRKVLARVYRLLRRRGLTANLRRESVDLSGVAQVLVQDAGGLVIADLLRREHPDLRFCLELAPPVAGAPTISA